jgi:hypothetical protein
MDKELTMEEAKKAADEAVKEHKKDLEEFHKKNPEWKTKDINQKVLDTVASLAVQLQPDDPSNSTGINEEITLLDGKKAWVMLHVVKEDD